MKPRAFDVTDGFHVESFVPACKQGGVTMNDAERIASLRFKLDGLRIEMRATLSGRLMRALENGLEALTDDTPRVEVAIERFETAIEILNDTLKRLEPPK